MKTVTWHVLGMGTSPDLHSILFEEHNFVVQKQRTVSLDLSPMTFLTAEMIADKMGTFSLFCQIPNHWKAGMKANFTVQTCPEEKKMEKSADDDYEYDYDDPDPEDAGPSKVQVGSITFSTLRTWSPKVQKWIHYIAAEEVEWDYAPKIPDYIDRTYMAQMLESGPQRIGKKYKKVVYTEYTDQFFQKRLEVKDQGSGLTGPMLQGEVEHEIKIVFKNMASRPYNIYPYGLTSVKPLVSSMLPKGQDLKNYAIKPNNTFVYNWKIAPEDGPVSSSSKCLTRFYYSSIDPVRDTASGLIGPLLVCYKNALTKNGHQMKSDKKRFLLFSAFDENMSWYLNENIQKYCKQPSSVNQLDPDFYRSNIMHGINGYMFDNLQMTFCKKEVTFWHILSVGSQTDVLSIYFSGHLFEKQGIYKDTLTLFPFEGETVYMEMEQIGTWIVGSVNAFFKDNGMRGTYTVTTCESVLRAIGDDDEDEDEDDDNADNGYGATELSGTRTGKTSIPRSIGKTKTCAKRQCLLQQELKSAGLSNSKLRNYFNVELCQMHKHIDSLTNNSNNASSLLKKKTDTNNHDDFEHIPFEVLKTAILGKGEGDVKRTNQALQNSPPLDHNRKLGEKTSTNNILEETLFAAMKTTGVEQVSDTSKESINQAVLQNCDEYTASCKQYHENKLKKFTTAAMPQKIKLSVKTLQESFGTYTESTGETFVVTKLAEANEHLARQKQSDILPEINNTEYVLKGADDFIKHNGMVLKKNEFNTHILGTLSELQGINATDQAENKNPLGISRPFISLQETSEVQPCNKTFLKALIGLKEISEKQFQNNASSTDIAGIVNLKYVNREIVAKQEKSLCMLQMLQATDANGTFQATKNGTSGSISGKYELKENKKYEVPTTISRRLTANDYIFNGSLESKNTGKNKTYSGKMLPSIMSDQAESMEQSHKPKHYLMESEFIDALSNHTLDQSSKDKAVSKKQAFENLVHKVILSNLTNKSGNNTASVKMPAINGEHPSLSTSQRKAPSPRSFLNRAGGSYLYDSIDGLPDEEHDYDDSTIFTQDYDYSDESIQPLDARTSGGRIRYYYIASIEIMWDYGFSKTHPFAEPRNKVSKVQSFKKVVFREFLDKTFTEPAFRGEREKHLGLLGPVIRAEVNDVVVITFMNLASRPYFLYTQLMPYKRTIDGIGKEGGDQVKPGKMQTFSWKVESHMAPTDKESDCKTWAYYSNVNSEKDINSGLVGPLLICKAKLLNQSSNSLPAALDLFLLFMTFDETKSWYFEENFSSNCVLYCNNQLGGDTLQKKHKFHAINGFVDNTLPGLIIPQNHLVRWHLLNMGGRDDIIAVHFHGQVLLLRKKTHHRMGVYNLYPGMVATVEMLPTKAGLWKIECEIAEHQEAGMSAYVLVYDPACQRPLGMTSGSILDYQITASGYYDEWKPSLARLDNSGSINAWSTEKQTPWIKVDLLKPMIIHSIQTQGASRLMTSMYISLFHISYSLDGISWSFYKGNSTYRKMSFTGNIDGSSKKVNHFNPPIMGRFIRLHAKRFSKRPTLRMELFGCNMHSCSLPLGMETKEIGPQQITASSKMEGLFGSWSPELARLNLQGMLNAWMPKDNNMNEWLQVNFGSKKKVTGVITQGARTLRKDMYITEFALSISPDGINWMTLQQNGKVKLFQGNSMNKKQAENSIDPPVFTQYIRLHPRMWYNGIALRLEFLGCNAEQRQ
ncbi:coagulation factor VIII isoform X1 [Protopterus annectens]|nr:coagulation factor VIII isoform X1 [Protopterus annectens]